jgi:hypothetical protein
VSVVGVFPVARHQRADGRAPPAPGRGTT